MKRQIQLRVGDIGSEKKNVTGEAVYGRDLLEHRYVSWHGCNWVHIWVQEIDKVVVNQDIFQYDKTSLGIR